MKYEFPPETEQEMYEAASRYEAEVSELGFRFADEIERVIQLLLERPELGSRLDDELRHFVLRRFRSLSYTRLSRFMSTWTKRFG